MLVTIVASIVAFVAGYAVKSAVGSATIAKVETELAKFESTASTDAKALVAKIRAVL